MAAVMNARSVAVASQVAASTKAPRAQRVVAFSGAKLNKARPSLKQQVAQRVSLVQVHPGAGAAVCRVSPIPSDRGCWDTIVANAVCRHQVCGNVWW